MSLNYADYKNDLPYPSTSDADHKSLRAAYNARDAEIYKQFRADFFKELDISPSHPKADKLFSVAWDMGHSAGYNEVMSYGYELVELVK